MFTSKGEVAKKFNLMTPKPLGLLANSKRIKSAVWSVSGFSNLLEENPAKKEMLKWEWGGKCSKFWLFFFSSRNVLLGKRRNSTFHPPDRGLWVQCSWEVQGGHLASFWLPLVPEKTGESKLENM